MTEPANHPSWARVLAPILLLPSLFGCGGDHGSAAPDGGKGSSSGSQASDAGGSTQSAIAIGKACGSDDDCADARCAKTLVARRGAAADPAPDGYCTASCSTQTECGPAAACVGAQFGTSGYCGLSCKAASDCRTGYRCITATGVTVADGGGSDAAVSATCQPIPETDKLTDGIVGSACTTAADCGAGSCLQNIPVVNTTYPGGYCTGRCSSDDACGANGVCVPGLLGSAGSCYLRCDEKTGCERAGYRCRVVSNVGRCVAAAPPLPDHVAGNACANDADCGGGALSCVSMLGSELAPGGYCSQSCAIAADCGEGGVCINGISIVTISSGRCLKACSAPADCREGYECRSFSGPSSDGPGACTPLLASDDAGVP